MGFTVKNAGLRTWAYAGARYGPRPWIQYSPAFFGALFACLLPRERRAVRRNLRRLLGERRYAVEQLDVLRTFVAYAHCLAESLAMDRSEASSPAEVHGAEHLEEALRQGRGAILVTAHTGAWDIAARELAQRGGMDVTIVMEKEPDARARGLHDSVRARARVSIVHAGGDPLDALPLLRRLRSGGIVAIQLDRAGGPSETLEPLLGGLPFSVPEGPFRLAALTGAPVLPVLARRVGFFRYEIHVRAPIFLGPRPDRPELTRAANAAMAEVEAFLRENATQWFHFSE